MSIIYLEPPTKAYMEIVILKEFVAQLNTAMVASYNDIFIKVRNYTAKLIRYSDFVEGLRQPELRGSFGIRPSDVGTTRTDIVEDVRRDTYIIYKPFKIIGKNIEGGWLMGIGKNYSESLKNNPACQTYTEKGVTIPWMKWTLEIGNSVVIADFRCKFQRGLGRSGFAIMVPDTAIGYRVPPQFAGTPIDNWITRTIIPNLSNYSDLIMRTMHKYRP